MNITGNKEIVRRFNTNCLEQGDDQAIDMLIDPHFINHTTPEGVPGNKEGMRYFIREVLHKAFSDIKVELLHQVAENDLVATHKIIHLTHMDTFMGIAPTGKKVMLRVMDIVRISDGRYMEHWGIRDTFSLIGQLKNKTV